MIKRKCGNCYVWVEHNEGSETGTCFINSGWRFREGISCCHHKLEEECDKEVTND